MLTLTVVLPVSASKRASNPLGTCPAYEAAKQTKPDRQAVWLVLLPMSRLRLRTALTAHRGAEG